MKKKQEIFEKNDKVVTRKIGGEVVLVPINQTGLEVQKIYRLNEVGAFIWEKLKTPQSRESLLNFLIENFDGDPEVIKNDVNHFLEDLKALEFIFIS
ncbi:MAG: PqqD family protein [Candidatus Aminicenantes bacterium]